MNAPANDAMHVVILGAGPAGLATGHELAANGVAVTVLERNGYVGGLCRTVHEAGYRFDLGGHRWFTKNEDLNNWFRRLMEGELVMVERISRIYYDGKYYMYPVAIGDVVKNAGPVTIVKAGFAFMWAAVRYAAFNRPIRNMKDAYTAQFGSTLYEMFFRRYTEKVWGKPCEELSADWVAQRSKGLSIWTVAREALSTRKSKCKSLIEEFMYPRDGYMRIPERMAEDIEGAGHRVLLNASVKGIVVHGPNDIEVVYATPEGERSIRAQHVVSTIPLSLLAQMVTPKADETVFKAARSLEFRDLITVNLQLRRKQVSKDTWLYVQDEHILFGRLHEPKNWSRAMVPDDDHTSLVLECFCTVGDAIWSLSDDDVARRCVRDLTEKLGFIKAGRRRRLERRSHALRLPGLRPGIRRQARGDQRLPQAVRRAAHRRPDGHVPLQQRRSFDRDGVAARAARSGLRRRPHGGQYRAGVPRDQAVGQDRARPLPARGARLQPRVTQQVE